MKKYEGYEKTEAFTGEYETLEPGGYICKIFKVVAEDKDYGTLLRIGFDIAEGPHKDYFKRLFDKKKDSNPDVKWGGMYYQTVKQDDLKYFKGFIVAIEQSNSGFKSDWDEQKLKGKLFGGVFGQEEFQANDGSIKLSTKCRWIRSVEQIKKGVDIPEIKKLSGGNGGYVSGGSQGGYIPEPEDDDLPF